MLAFDKRNLPRVNKSVRLLCYGEACDTDTSVALQLCYSLIAVGVVEDQLNMALMLLWDFPSNVEKLLPFSTFLKDSTHGKFWHRDFRVIGLAGLYSMMLNIAESSHISVFFLEASCYWFLGRWVEFMSLGHGPMRKNGCCLFHQVICYHKFLALFDSFSFAEKRKLTSQQVKD